MLGIFPTSGDGFEVIVGVGCRVVDIDDAKTMCIHKDEPCQGRDMNHPETQCGYDEMWWFGAGDSSGHVMLDLKCAKICMMWK